MISGNNNNNIKFIFDKVADKDYFIVHYYNTLAGYKKWNNHSVSIVTGIDVRTASNNRFIKKIRTCLSVFEVYRCTWFLCYLVLPLTIIWTFFNKMEDAKHIITDVK